MWLLCEVSGSAQNKGKIDPVEDHDIKIRADGHAGGFVLVEDRPLLRIVTVPHPDGADVVGVPDPARVPVLGSEHDGVGVVVGEGMVDKGVVVDDAPGSRDVNKDRRVHGRDQDIKVARDPA